MAGSKPLSAILASGDTIGGVMLGKILDHLEVWLISALIAGATLLIFFAVVHRYGTGLSIDFSKLPTRIMV